MHQIKVFVLGSSSFVTTLIELKSYLKFNLFNNANITGINYDDKYDILLFEDEFLENNNSNFFEKSNTIKILAGKKENKIHDYDAFLKLPTTIDQINYLIEKSAVKKVFNKNSSIQIKEYLLDKNGKKLTKENKSVIITEKEVQLLELFLHNTKPTSKKDILSSVWHYSSDADTHTVETHIYRLRKKINEMFSDDSFIKNNKEGYYF